MKIFFTAIALLFAFTLNAQVDYFNTTTNGTYSSAIGLNNDADGANAFVGGGNSKAQGQNSFAFGNSSEATATDAIALGLSAKSNGVASLTFGSYLTAQGTNSFVIGKGITSIYRLINTIPNSIMFGMNATKPTLFISPTYGLDKTGKIGIGNVTDPQTKLHLKADTLEDATIRLEPRTDYLAKIEFGNENNCIQAVTNSSLSFYTSGVFRFANGDVFIEDIDKGIIMKSPDGQCWRGVLDNSGNLNFSIVNCDTIISFKNDVVAEKYQASVFPNPAEDIIIVEVADLSRSAIVQIFTMGGDLLFSEKINQTQKLIHTSSFPPGSYIVQITDSFNNILFVQKIMIL